MYRTQKPLFTIIYTIWLEHAQWKMVHGVTKGDSQPQVHLQFKNALANTDWKGHVEWCTSLDGNKEITQALYQPGADDHEYAPVSIIQWI